AKDVLKKDDKTLKLVSEGREPVEQTIGEFREDFGKLLQRLPIKALVVFIDDLDRCLPENIVDTFEALRLFLAVDKTAFVIGADQRIVYHENGMGYPKRGDESVDIGRHYLEKIIQTPLNIPPLEPMESEGYLNLLGCQRHLTPLNFYRLVS